MFIFLFVHGLWCREYIFVLIYLDLFTSNASIDSIKIFLDHVVQMPFLFMFFYFVIFNS